MKDAFYHQCPKCGHKQRSLAEKRVRCHRCGRTYTEKDHRCPPPRPKSDGRFQRASELKER